MSEIEAGTPAEPNRAVAQRAIAGIVGFWLLAGAAVQAKQQGPVGIGGTIAAIACGWVFFYSLTETAAERTGRRALDYWTYKVPMDERRALTRGYWRPSWWAPIVRATGWPTKPVAVVLVLALAFALVSIAARFISLFA